MELRNLLNSSPDYDDLQYKGDANKHLDSSSAAYSAKGQQTSPNSYNARQQQGSTPLSQQQQQQGNLKSPLINSSSAPSSTSLKKSPSQGMNPQQQQQQQQMPNQPPMQNTGLPLHNSVSPGTGQPPPGMFHMNQPPHYFNAPTPTSSHKPPPSGVVPTSIKPGNMVGSPPTSSGIVPQQQMDSKVNGEPMMKVKPMNPTSFNKMGVLEGLPAAMKLIGRYRQGEIKNVLPTREGPNPFAFDFPETPILLTSDAFGSNPEIRNSWNTLWRPDTLVKIHPEMYVKDQKNYRDLRKSISDFKAHVKHVNSLPSSSLSTPNNNNNNNNSTSASPSSTTNPNQNGGQPTTTTNNNSGNATIPGTEEEVWLASDLPIMHQLSCLTSKKNKNCLGCSPLWKSVQGVAEEIRPWGNNDLLRFEPEHSESFLGTLAMNGSYTAQRRELMAVDTLNTMFYAEDPTAVAIWGFIAPNEFYKLTEEECIGVELFDHRTFLDPSHLETRVKVVYGIQRPGQTVLIPANWTYFIVRVGKGLTFSASWNILRLKHLVDARKEVEMYRCVGQYRPTNLSSLVMAAAQQKMDELESSSGHARQQIVDLLYRVVPLLKVLVLEEVMEERVALTGLVVLSYDYLVDQFKQSGGLTNIRQGLTHEMAQVRTHPINPLENLNFVNDDDDELHVCALCKYTLFNSRRNCTTCKNFDLCDTCYHSGAGKSHPHKFKLLRKNNIDSLIDLVDSVRNLISDYEPEDAQPLVVIPPTNTTALGNALASHLNSAAPGNQNGGSGSSHHHHLHHHQVLMNNNNAVNNINSMNNVGMGSGGGGNGGNMNNNNTNPNSSNIGNVGGNSSGPLGTFTSSAPKTRKRDYNELMSSTMLDLKPPTMPGSSPPQPSSPSYDEEVIDCICGNNKDLGFMISCERCYAWLHGKCVGISKRNEPEVYYCPRCVKKMNVPHVPAAKLVPKSVSPEEKLKEYRLS